MDDIKKQLEKQNEELQTTRAGLQAALDKYFELYDFAPVGLFTLDQKALIRAVNTAGSKLLGMDRSRLLNESFLPFLAPGSADIFNACLSAAFESGKEQSCEVKLLRSKKNLIYTLIEGKIAKESLWGENQLQIAVTDITYRKLAEEKERETRQHFEELMNNLPVAVYRNTPGPEGHFIEFNPAILAMFEAGSKDEFIKYNASDLYRNPELRKTISEELLKQGTIKNKEVEFKTLTGKSFWGALTASTKINDDGSIFFDGFIQDITERKRMEEELKESERKYRGVVEDQTEMICRFKPDGTYIFANAIYCGFFGKQKEDIIGKKWFPDAFPEDVKMIQSKLAAMAAKNPVVVIENRVYSGKGELRWFQFINRGFYDPKGNLIETQSVGRDITERKQKENALDFLSKTAMELLEFPSDGNLYFYAAEQLKTLVGDCIVGVNTFDQATESISTRAIVGLGELSDKVVKLIGRNPIGMSYKLNRDAKKNMPTGELIHIPGKLCQLTFGQIPKAVCETLEKLYNITDAYAMGMFRQGKLFGNVAILLRKGAELKDKETIKTFVNQVAIALLRE